MGASTLKANITDEFKANGLLDRFYKRVEKGEFIDLKNVLRELLMQDTIAAIINDIEEAGMSAQVQKYDGGIINLKITQCSMSFG